MRSLSTRFQLHLGCLGFLLVGGLAGGSAGCSGDDDAGDNGVGDPPGENTFEPVEQPSGAMLELDRKTYAEGQTPVVSVGFGGVAPPQDPRVVVLACPETNDAEMLDLEPVADGFGATGVPVRVADGPGQPNDGELVVPPGASFSALYFVDREQLAESEIPEDVLFDVAVVTGSPDGLETQVEASLAITPDEQTPPAGGRPVGTIVLGDGLPVQIATEELIAEVASSEELDALLLRTGGEVLAGPIESDASSSYRISVDPERFEPDAVGGLRALFGEEGDLIASHRGAVRIYAAALALQLEGFRVGVNPRIQWHGPPPTSEIEDDDVGFTMKMTPAPDASGPCVPDDPARPCAVDVPALWAHLDLEGVDGQRVNVAFLDMGFAPNADFRTPATGPIVQCDMSARPVRCGPGAAEGPPTVSNSFFGDRSWHGTGVVTAAGGVVNNGFGAAGVGGQVVVPMLYEYDLASYVFDIGAGIRRAVDDGADCVNISGGYPCNILTTVGPDFNICTAGGRAGICALVTAAAHAAAATVCATLGPIPFVGAAACGAAQSAAASATAACVSTLAFGDLAGPMRSAVRYAERRGVPVIASAGNAIPRDSLPDVIRDVVDVGDTSLDRWQVVPAAIPDVIAVGAVDSAFRNTHFQGDAVDVWAPTPSVYFAPSSTSDPSSPITEASIGATSGAAPFVTGTIAAMMAVDDSLLPSNPALSDGDREAIVGRIRAAIRSDAATWDDAELTARGFASDPLRRRVIHPLGAVRSVSALQSELDARSYSTSLNFEETLGTDDRRGDATAFSFGEGVLGTILDVSGEDGGSSELDVDWYAGMLPSTPSRAYLTEVEILALGDGAPSISEAGFRLISRGGAVEERLVYETIGSAGAELAFGLRGGDSVYRVTVSGPTVADPEVDIVAPTPGTSLCAGESITLEANVGYRAYPDFTVSSDRIRWFDGGMSLGTGPTQSATFDEGTLDLRVEVFGDASISDAETYVVEDCQGSPPTVNITNPSAAPGPGPDADFLPSTNDADGFYQAITLTAAVSDLDETIADSQIEWTTDQGSVQPGGPASGTQVLGTGRSLPVRLYTSCASPNFGTIDHEIIVTVTDSQGNQATSRRVIRVVTLC